MEGKLSAAIHLPEASGRDRERGHRSEKSFSRVKMKTSIEDQRGVLKKGTNIL